MTVKVQILSVGKTKESWLQEALKLYETRLRGQFVFEYSFAKDDAQLLHLLRKESRILCLDPEGKSYDSPEFSQFLFNEIEKGGSRLCFVIGGPEGLPPSLRQGGVPLLSLSTLTLTHQMVRLLLVEQIYRANEIQKGTGYHKS